MYIVYSEAYREFLNGLSHNLSSCWANDNKKKGMEEMTGPQRLPRNWSIFNVHFISLPNMCLYACFAIENSLSFCPKCQCIGKKGGTGLDVFIFPFPVLKSSVR